MATEVTAKSGLYTGKGGKVQEVFIRKARRGWVDLKKDTQRHLTEGVSHYEHRLTPNVFGKPNVPSVRRSERSADVRKNLPSAFPTGYPLIGLILKFEHIGLFFWHIGG